MMKKKRYPTVAELEKSFELEASWADDRYGARVPRLTKPGRPRKGEKLEPTRPHSVRVPDSVWQALEVKAKRRGLSTNAALRLAAAEWISRSQ
jgi:hypothetical protein